MHCQMVSCDTSLCLAVAGAHDHRHQQLVGGRRISGGGQVQMQGQG